MFRIALFASFLLALTGCSGGYEAHTVTGTITYNNQPVADAQVAFIPLDETGAIRPARGQTDSQGNYTLKSSPRIDAAEVAGAMAGEYKVTVTKAPPQNQIVTYEDLQKQNQKPAIPPRYADTQQTPLKASVTKGGENKFDFALEDGE